ncbi:MAG: TIM barrel protein [Rhizobiaceae bacterium]|nr:TIM barrel protein [Rhizobiaceae bacterium]
MSLFSIHLGYVLGALPFPDRFARARELGFRAVEIPFPYQIPAGDYAALLTQYDLRQISIGAPTGDYRKGETGFAVDPALREAFVRSLEQAAAYAERIGCPAIHIFSGCANPDLPAALTEETYCENLSMAADFLSRRGIATLVEPINSSDFPGYYLDSFQETLRLMAKIGSPDIRIIFDIYHTCMMGEDPAALLVATHGQVQHVQFADYPGRHEPGSGTLDIAAIVDVLTKVGYAGSAGLEYIPTRPVAEPLALPPALAGYAGLDGSMS